MMPSLLVLGLAYAVVAALLLTLCVSLPGQRVIKVVLIVGVSLFYGVTWLGHQGMLGWPTAEDMPENFRVLWITIDEPDKTTRAPGGIFFWVRALDEAGIPFGSPRAHFVPYTDQAAEEAEAALGKMEKGDVMNGTLSRNAVQERGEAPERENENLGNDAISGNDGYRPTFELIEVPPPTLPPKA